MDRDIDKGNKPNVHTVKLPLSDKSDLSYNPEEYSIFLKAGNLGFEIIIQKFNT